LDHHVRSPVANAQLPLVGATVSDRGTLRGVSRVRYTCRRADRDEVPVSPVLRITAESTTKTG